jgi:hypothetical protein
VLERFAGFVKDVFELERDEFERRSETFVVFERESREQKILRIRWRRPVPRRRRRSSDRGSRGRTACGHHGNLQW